MTSISVLLISPHYHNYLRGQGIDTVEQLQKADRKKLVAAKNFGYAGLEEVKREFCRLDLAFKCSCGNDVAGEEESCYFCWQGHAAPWSFF